MFRVRDMSNHVIVWDLETVPDIAGYAAANGLTGKSDEEIREALGNKFPKHIYHSIVCIGALVAHKEPDHRETALMEPRSSDTSLMVRSKRSQITAITIVNTYRVWLRYELFRGKLTDIAFQASEANLSEFIKARSNAKPHLAVLT